MLSNEGANPVDSVLLLHLPPWFCFIGGHMSEPVCSFWSESACMHVYTWINYVPGPLFCSNLFHFHQELPMGSFQSRDTIESRVVVALTLIEPVCWIRIHLFSLWFSRMTMGIELTTVISWGEVEAVKKLETYLWRMILQIPDVPYFENDKA